MGRAFETTLPRVLMSGDAGPEAARRAPPGTQSRQ
ncbi:LEPR-XLL domain-containing protein [Mycobacterium parmense]